MKKLFALMLAAAMLFAMLTAHALPAGEAGRDVKPAYLEGYIVGNKNGAAFAEWIGFSADDAENFDIYDTMLTTYAAAYYNGYVYGYVYGYDSAGTLHTEYYRMNASTHSVEYIEGCSSGGELVFGMAYSYVDGVMYALCNENNPYIASVDLATGALTRVVTIQTTGAANLGVQTFAIDSEGRFLALSFSATGAKLISIDKSTGAPTTILSTQYDTFYAQSMVYRHADNCIYWAHADNNSTYNDGLVVIDLNDQSVTFKGVIGTDLELTGLYIAEDDQGNSPAPAEEHTVTFVDWDGTVLSVQQVPHGASAAEPDQPSRVGYSFVGWDTAFTNVQSDITVTALYSINSYTLTINYVDADGVPVAEAYIASVEYGAAYSVASPDVAGYAPDAAVVVGVMGAEDITVAVTYYEAGQGLMGDVNCDGAVDMRDVSDLNAYLVNCGTLSADGLAVADINGDGVVDAYDSTLIAMLALGISF